MHIFFFYCFNICALDFKIKVNNEMLTSSKQHVPVDGGTKYP